MTTANIVACAIIFAWAVWCVFSKAVKDGILGKIFFSAIALAAITSALAGHHQAELSPQAYTMNFCMAGLGVRHFFLKQIKPWFLEWAVSRGA